MKAAKLLMASLLVCFCLTNKLLAADPVPWKLDQQWQPCNVSLRAVHAFDSRHVWVGGGEGKIFTTTDGGANWRDVSPQGYSKSEFRSLWSLGLKTAVAATAGQPAVILRTEDGGESWSEVFRSDAAEAFFDGMRFCDPLRGMAFSDPVDGRLLIVRTINGGQSWQTISADKLPAADQGEAGFAASNSSLILFTAQTSAATTTSSVVAWIGLGGANDGASRLYRSDDFGDRWEVSSVDPIQRNASSGIFALAIMNPQRGVAVGGDYKQEAVGESHIALTEDGGHSWREPKGQSPRGFRSGLTYVNDVGFVCVGPSGCEVSIDGEEWQPLTETGYHAVIADDAQGLWTVGSTGRIAHFLRSF